MYVIRVTVDRIDGDARKEICNVAQVVTANPAEAFICNGNPEQRSRPGEVAQAILEALKTA